MEKDELISTLEAAKILGVSRITVFNKVKSGNIKATKVGRNFVIKKGDLLKLLDATLDDAKKQEIDKAVDKAVEEYRETFQLLGKE